MKEIFISIAIMFVRLIFGCSSQLESMKSQGFVEPSLESKPRIIFPKIAEEENYSGDVKALLYISENGSVYRVDVLESSGYKVLDEAAVDYFKRFVFNPATGNGKPISCRAIWDMKFSLVDQKSNAKDYVEEILDLYNEVTVADGDEKDEILDNIFSLHKQFINSMWNSLNFNASVAKVVLPNIAEEWANESNTYPLVFILYHDFNVRYPDYHNSEDINKEIRNSLKSDIEYIIKSPARSNGDSAHKKELLQKIKIFVEMNYPELLNEDLDFDRSINS